MTVAFLIAAAIVLGLLLFLIKEVRRSVNSSSWDSSPRWRKWARVSLVAIVLLLVILGFWGFLIEPGRLVVREETIQIDNWPRELDGLRVAVLADIHVDDWFVTSRKVREIVNQTNQLKPDLIVILGDYMSSNSGVRRQVEPRVFAPLLKDFQAPLGVYSVLGNHDVWYSVAKTREALEQNGIKVLENEVAPVSTRGTTLWLVGLADLWTRPQKIAETVAQVPEGQPVILLAHNPDIFPRVPASVPLVLAGHTHGGQVRLPIVGSVTEASEFGERYVMGHVIENNHHLFVTTGIGTSILPVRFGVPPEIVLLHLQSSAERK